MIECFSPERISMSHVIFFYVIRRTRYEEEHSLYLLIHRNPLNCYTQDAPIKSAKFEQIDKDWRELENDALASFAKTG